MTNEWQVRRICSAISSTSVENAFFKTSNVIQWGDTFSSNWVPAMDASGNSFDTPHVTGICALIRSKHPELTPFQLKSVLHLTSSNVGGTR